MRSFLTLVICAAASVAMLGQSKSDSARADGRRIMQMPQTPLAQLVRPGEEDLTVVISADPPLTISPPQNVPMSAWLTQRAAGIVVAQITQVSPVLTSRGDWIRSTVEASIIDVVKTSNQWTPRHGDTFSFDQDGGVALIDGTRVHAVVPWTKPFEPGKQYLLFVQVDPSNKRIVVAPSSAYDLSAARPVRLAGRAPSHDDIEATETVEALGRVRTTAASAR